MVSYFPVSLIIQRSPSPTGGSNLSGSLVLANRIFRARQCYCKWLLRLLIISKVFLLSWSSAAAYGVIYSLIKAFAQDGIAETITAWIWFDSDFCSLPKREGESTTELNYCWSKKNASFHKETCNMKVFRMGKKNAQNWDLTEVNISLFKIWYVPHWNPSTRNGFWCPNLEDVCSIFILSTCL